MNIEGSGYLQHQCCGDGATSSADQGDLDLELDGSGAGYGL